MSKRYLILRSAATETCGVEEFARQLAQRLPGPAETWVLGEGFGRFLARLRAVDGIILNFPVVAWKRKLVWPALTALAARLRRREVLVVLHEWAALDWKRRLVLAPVMALASRIVFSAPEIATEFGHSPLSRVATDDRNVIPIPPNLRAPPQRRGSAVSRRLDEERARGRIILAQFGSIYPKKQSKAVLQVAERLIARGHDVFTVFIGSFIKGSDDVEADFRGSVQATGLSDRVLVTGYIGDEAELFALFEAVDVFCYVFAEGLTSRRASVLAAALFGKPVVVNAPAAADALQHHGLYLKLIETGLIRLVAIDADADSLAEAVLSATTDAPAAIDLTTELDRLWQAVGDVIIRRRDA